MLVIDKPALAFEVVGFHPGCKATEDGILDLEGFFTGELANKIDCSTLAGKLLHLPIVRHDGSEQVARLLAHLSTLMREY